MIVVRADHRRKRTRTASRGSRSLRAKTLLVTLAVGFLAALTGGAFAAGALLYRAGKLGDFKVWFSPRAVPNFVRAHLTTNDLPTVRLDLKFRHLTKLREKREEAIARGILFASDADFVPMRIRFEDRTIRAKVRLKGDWTDHLESDRWSYRVHIKGGDQLFGMRRFSLQTPGTRRYLNEWALLEHLRHEEVLAPRYRFVNLIVNGDDKGLYAVEEGFSKELLESQKRLDGVIVKLDEGDFWQQADRMSDIPDWLDANVVEPSDFDNSRILSFRSNRIERTAGMPEQRDAAFRLLRGFQTRALTASQVFDVRILARFLAVYDVWSVEHGIRWHNLRFYYDPVIGRLEPIGFDVSAGVPKAGLQSLTEGYDAPNWTVVAMDDPRVAEAYAAALARMSKPAYLDDLEKRLGEQHDRYLRLLQREAPALTPVWAGLAEKQAYIREVLSPPSTIVGYAYREDSPSEQPGVSHVRLTLGSVVTLPVEVLGFRIDGGPLASAGDVLAADNSVGISRRGSSTVILPRRRPRKPQQSVFFEIPVDALEPSGSGNAIRRIIVESRLLGLEEVYETELSVLSAITEVGPDMPRQPTVEEALDQHMFLERCDEEDTLAITPGTWTVERDLILPDGIALKATKGTVLRFAPNAILYANGPLLFEGTATQPIVLEPSGPTWPGLVVADARARSVLEYVEIRSTAGIDRSGWALTGATLFYRCPVTLRHCRFMGTTAEDALNIKRTHMELLDTEFADCASDALDADFCTGAIRRCTFHDILGDAIDVSGSTISAANLHLRDIGDKALSVGENSDFTAIDTQVMRVGIAAASKDLSLTRLDRIDIVDASIGLACYTKKPEYGPASIVAHDVSFEKTRQRMLVHTGSSIMLDDMPTFGTELDVKRLYEAGILGTAPDTNPPDETGSGKN